MSKNPRTWYRFYAKVSSERYVFLVEKFQITNIIIGNMSESSTSVIKSIILCFKDPDDNPTSVI